MGGCQAGRVQPPQVSHAWALRVPLRGILGTGDRGQGAGVGVLGAKRKAGSCTEPSRAEGEVSYITENSELESSAQESAGTGVSHGPVADGSGPSCHMQMQVEPALCGR